MPKAPRGPYIDKPFREALRLAVRRPGDADVKGKTKLEKIVNSLMNEAVKGDVPAMKEIADRLDGKVPQAVTGEGGGPIAMAITWLPSSK